MNSNTPHTKKAVAGREIHSIPRFPIVFLKKLNPKDVARYKKTWDKPFKTADDLKRSKVPKCIKKTPFAGVVEFPIKILIT
jgi:hypothetical protein